MSSNKAIVYIMSPINGNWVEHPKLAKSKLEILTEVLKEDGFIENHGEIVSSRKFRVPYEKPNLLELKKFFGDSPLDDLAEEVKRICEDKSFYKTLADQAYYGQGFFLVRVEGDKDFKNRFNLTLDGRLDAMKKMHGVEYKLMFPSEQN